MDAQDDDVERAQSAHGLPQGYDGPNPMVASRVFSLLPSENATGNWVKVIQYFTVRIHVKNDPNYPLRVGASAHVVIHTMGNTTPMKKS